jgi:transposase-like protein
MSGKRRHYSDQFKFKVALEASKGQRTVNELASEGGAQLYRVQFR